MFSRKLPNKGDIFNKKKPRTFRGFSSLHYKPLKMLKATGIVTGLSVLAFGLIMLVPTGQQSYKQLASTDDTTINHNNGGDDYRGKDYRDDDYQDWYTPSYIPPIRVIDSNPNPPAYNGQNLTGVSQSIIAMQQQVGGTMQTCVNNARQGANQIIAMKRQIEQLQKQLDNLNDQGWNIDTSTPAGENRRKYIDQQAQALQRQIDSINDNLSRYQDSYNQNNDRCRQNLDRYLQAREDAEGRLNDAFNQSMDISTDLPPHN